MSINFETNEADAALIKKIVERAVSKVNYPPLDLEMDITAVHLNDAPLDLEKLLGFDDFNFMHDISGIRRCLDRETGRLTRFFVPRSSR